MDDIIQGFAEFRESIQGLSRLVVAGSVREARLLSDFLSRRGASLVTAGLSDLEAYLAERATPLSVNTRVNVIGRIKALYRFLHLVTIRDDDLGMWLPYPRFDKLTFLPRILATWQVERLFSSLSGRSDPFGPRDLAIAILLYTPGMRNGELGALQVGDVDFAEGVVHIRKGKGDQERWVPLLPEASEVLQRYLEARTEAGAHSPLFPSKRGHRLSAPKVSSIFRRWGDRLGWRLHPHQLRHACASHLLAAGAPLELIQQLLGHRQVGNTLLYARLSDPYLAECMKLHPLNQLQLLPSGGRDMEREPLEPAPHPHKLNKLVIPKKLDGPLWDRVEEFLASPIVQTWYRPSSLEIHRTALRAVVFWLHKQDVTRLEEIRSRHLLEFLEHRKAAGVTQSTLERHVDSLHALFRYAVRIGWVQKDPAKPIKITKGRPLERITLTEEEMLRLLAAPDRTEARGCQDYILLLILYGTGLRAAETSALNAGDIDIKKGWLTVRKGKGGRVRQVPLPRAVLQELRRYMGLYRQPPDSPIFRNAFGGRLTPEGVSERVKVCALQAQLPKAITAHTLRHTFCEHLLKAGVPLQAVMRMLGHQRPEETSPYVHADMGRMREAVATLGHVLTGQQEDGNDV